MATIIKLSSTRKASEEAKNLSFGTGKLGGLTVTGTIYGASGYIVPMEDEDTGIIEDIDLSSQLYKLQASVTFGKSIKEEVQTKLAKFFAEAEENELWTISAGLIIECRTISAPIEGIHPISGEKTENVLITCTNLIGIEVAPDLDNDNLLERTASARKNAKERKENGLKAYLAKKTEGMLQILEDCLPQERKKEKTLKEKAKEKTGKVVNK